MPSSVASIAESNEPARDGDSNGGASPAPEAAASPAGLLHEGGAPSKKRKRIHDTGGTAPGNNGETVRDRIGQSNAALRAAEVAEIDRVVRGSDGRLSRDQFRHVTLDLLPGQKLGIVLRDLKAHGIPKIRELKPGMPAWDMIPPAHRVGCGIASLKCDGVGHARPRTANECFAFFRTAREQDGLAGGSSEKVQVEMLLIKAKALPHLRRSPLLPRNPWPRTQQQLQQQQQLLLQQLQLQQLQQQQQQQLKLPPFEAAPLDQLHPELANGAAAFVRVVRRLEARVAQLTSELEASKCSVEELKEQVRRLNGHRNAKPKQPPALGAPPRGRIADRDGVLDAAVADELDAAFGRRDPEAAPFREYELRVLGNMVHKGFAAVGSSGKLKLPPSSGRRKFEIVIVPVQKKGADVGSRCRRERRKVAERWMGHLSPHSWRDMMESYFREHPQEARDMVVRHLGGNLDRFREKHDGPKKVELPADFVSYDNTLAVDWNRRYGELVRFKEDHGHIRLPCSDPLGKWISTQRSQRRDLCTPLSAAWEKRIELLDALGFSWDYQTGETRARVKGGDPRFNRAMAAKIVYPHLTFRQALCLGGYTEEELDVINDKKHTWRTYFVTLKDIMRNKLKTYDPANVRAKPSTKNIEKLVRILRSDAEDKFEQVFGDQAGLMLGLLTNSGDGIDESYADQIDSKKPNRDPEEECDVNYCEDSAGETEGDPFNM